MRDYIVTLGGSTTVGQTLSDPCMGCCWPNSSVCRYRSKMRGGVTT